MLLLQWLTGSRWNLSYNGPPHRASTSSQRSETIKGNRENNSLQTIFFLAWLLRRGHEKRFRSPFGYACLRTLSEPDVWCWERQRNLHWPQNVMEKYLQRFFFVSGRKQKSHFHSLYILFFYLIFMDELTPSQGRQAEGLQGDTTRKKMQNTNLSFYHVIKYFLSVVLYE